MLAKCLRRHALNGPASPLHRWELLAESRAAFAFARQSISTFQFSAQELMWLGLAVRNSGPPTTNTLYGDRGCFGRQ
jgi:hypothetical protein